MVVIVIGLALIGFGVYDYRRQAVPGDAVMLEGTVTAIASRQSRIAGRRNAVLHAPVVAYRHPQTGRTEELRPESYGSRRHAVGDVVAVAYSPGSGRATLVAGRRWNGLAALAGIGLALIAFQVAAWVV